MRCSHSVVLLLSSPHPWVTAAVLQRTPPLLFITETGADAEHGQHDVGAARWRATAGIQRFFRIDLASVQVATTY